MNNKRVTLTRNEIIVIILALDMYAKHPITQAQGRIALDLTNGKFDKLGREIDFIGDYDGA